MKTHLGWCRNVPTVCLAGIGGVGGTGFHISRVIGCGSCKGGSPDMYAKALTVRWDRWKAVGVVNTDVSDRKFGRMTFPRSRHPGCGTDWTSQVYIGGFPHFRLRTHSASHAAHRACKPVGAADGALPDNSGIHLQVLGRVESSPLIFGFETGRWGIGGCACSYASPAYI